MPRRAARALALAALLCAGACSDDATRVEAHLERAERQLAAGHPDQAAIEFRAALQRRPDDARAHYGLALAALASGRLANAVWELRETLRLRPDHAEAAERLAALLLLGDADAAGEALAIAEAGLEVEGARPTLWLAKGRALAKLGRLDEADRALRVARELAPENVPVLRHHAALYDRLERPDLAEAALRQAVAVSPAPALAARAQLARWLADARREDEALATLREGVEAAGPDDLAQARYALARGLAASDRLDEAASLLAESITDAPDEPSLRELLAAVELARGRAAQARAALLELARIAPRSPAPQIALSRLELERGSFETALAAANAAIAIAPEEVGALLQKADVLHRMGVARRAPEPLAESRALLEQVLAARPDDPQARLLAARLAISERRTEQALELLRGLVGMRPEWAAAHEQLGIALHLHGRVDEGQRALEHALALDPAAASAARALARVRARAGDPEGSVAAARRALALGSDGPGLRLQLAESLEALGKRGEAEQALLEVPEVQRPQSIHQALARLASLRGDEPAARQHRLRAAASAAGEVPESPGGQGGRVSGR